MDGCPIHGDAEHQDALEHTVSAVLLQHAIGTGDKPRPQPRTSYPILEEVELGKRYAGYVDRAKPFYGELAAAMPRLIASAHSGHGDHNDAGEVERARQLLEAARARWGTWVTEQEVQTLAAYFGERVSVAQRADLARQIRAGLGVDVPIADTVTKELISEFAHANATLISTIPGELHGDIARLAMRALSKRMKPETFGGLLEDQFGISERHARGIARDQMGKLNGSISESRQRSLGISHYFWITMQDDRVRPGHRIRLFKRFSWDNPPIDGHPGIPYNCRCTAQPDLSPIITKVKNARILPQLKRRASNPFEL